MVVGDTLKQWDLFPPASSRVPSLSIDVIVSLRSAFILTLNETDNT